MQHGQTMPVKDLIATEATTGKEIIGNDLKSCFIIKLLIQKGQQDHQQQLQLLHQPQHHLDQQ